MTEIFSRISRQTSLRSISVTLKDLEDIAKLALDKNLKAVEIEKAAAQRFQAEPDEIKKYIDTIERTQKLSIVVYGPNGEVSMSSDPSFFQSHLLPLEIVGVTIETQTKRKIESGSEPNNFLRINFDFSSLKFLSPQFAPDGTLQNFSTLQVQGTDEPWVTSTFQTLLARIYVTRNRRGFLNGAGTYVGLLIFFITPMVIILVERLYQNYQSLFDGISLPARIGWMAYGYLLSVVAYRLFFNYALWVFPSVELVNDRATSTKHRKVIFAICSSLLLGGLSYLIYKK